MLCWRARCVQRARVTPDHRPMTPEFRSQLKLKLAPLLRAAGFTGSGSTFRRSGDGMIQVLNVQGSQWGGSCCVNLGVHLSFMPTVIGQPADPKKITEPLCEFRRRLAPAGQSDCWWKYGSDEREAARSADELVDLVQRVALPHFERFRAFPGSFEGITPQALAADDLSAFPGRSSVARAGLVMARIAAHLGQPERSREFAEIGLAAVKVRGGGLVHELEKLAGRASR